VENRLLVKALNILAGFLGMLPLGFTHFVSKALSIFCADILRLRRQIVLKNLETAGFHLENIHRSTYLSFMQTVIEFLRSSKKQPLHLKVKLEGREYLDEALSHGQGAFVLCLHLGNWEALASCVSTRVAPASVVVKKIGSDVLDKWINRKRQDNGYKGIIKNGFAIRSIRRELDRNHIVGFVMDQHRPGEPYIPFFGRPARTNTTLARLVLKWGTPVVPAFIVRQDNNIDHVATLLPALAIPDGIGINELSELFNRQLEEIIKRKPEQYFWLHNRWK
jgi:Kdo2-lipid IVA lauroyltransferase/acyltransferase